MNLMRKYCSVLLVICSLFIYSDTQAQTFGDLIKQSIAEADQENARQLQIRLRDGSKIAPTLIPKAKMQSELGSYLVEELTVLNEAEKNKQRKRNRSREIRRIERDLGSLDVGIDAWERKDYSPDLNELTVTLSKHTTKYNDIVSSERERLAAVEKAERERLAALEKARLEKIAAAEKAERERLAALEKARQEKEDAFIERCEPGGASDDPFAAFNAVQEPRMDLVLVIGQSKMKLQATKNGECMWLGNYNRSDIIPALVTEENFQQNPNMKAQYSLEIDTSGQSPAITSISDAIKFSISRPGSFILDFEKYQCAFVKKDKSRQAIPCDDGKVIDNMVPPSNSSNNTRDPARMSCTEILFLFEQNATLAAQRLGMAGMTRYGECLYRDNAGSLN